MELTVCPECGQVAEIEWQDRTPDGWARDGLAKVRCLDRHWFLMPSGRLLSLAGRAPQRQQVW